MRLLIILSKCVDAEIVVENDFLSHDILLEFVFISLPANARDSIVSCPANAAPTVFFATLAMLSIRAIE
jgi:hypothetical protein